MQAVSENALSIITACILDNYNEKFNDRYREL